MSYSSISTIRITLSILCMCLCMCAVVLPEKSLYSFNLDYLEYLNRNSLFRINSLVSSARKKMFELRGSNAANLNEPCSVTSRDEFNYLDMISLKTGGSDPSAKPKFNGDECETRILANSLIKKINSENHCKTGKLNPLYEEEAANSSHNFNGSNSPPSNVLFNKTIQHSSTKF